MKYSFIILVHCMLIWCSCSEKPGTGVKAIQPFKESPLDSAYIPIRPRVQSFTIDNNKANILKAANGTQLLIPANCFNTLQGDPVDGNVQIEIIETASLEDFVTAGLTTLSDGKLLISNGMMYINAKSGDDPVQIKKGSSITVSMPTLGADGDFKMFRGDGRNWVVDSTMTETDYAIPLPLDLLYPDGNKFLYICIDNVGAKNEKYTLLDTTIVSVTDKKYENTIIATEEFKNRYYRLMFMTQNISYFLNRDYYFGDGDCTKWKTNYDIWKVYFDFPNRSFRESDSIAKKIYVDYFNTNKNKLDAFCNEVNIHMRKHYSNWTDTNYYFDFRKTSLGDWYFRVLEYSPINRTEFKTVNTHGVDINADDAYDLLKSKGVEEEEINELLDYNFRKQSKIRMYQRYNEIEARKREIGEKYQETVFSIEVMGWINCDQFFDDPDAGKAVMYVSNSSGSKLDFIDCSLVIPDMNVRLSSFPAEGDTYSFTRKDGPYTKLPIGKQAVVVGVTIQHDSIFFASRKINIKDGLKIDLPMQYIKSGTLKDSLAIALK